LCSLFILFDEAMNFEVKDLTTFDNIQSAQRDRYKHRDRDRDRDKDKDEHRHRDKKRKETHCFCTERKIK